MEQPSEYSTNANGPTHLRISESRDLIELPETIESRARIEATRMASCFSFRLVAARAPDAAGKNLSMSCRPLLGSVGGGSRRTKNLDERIIANLA